MKQIEEGGAAMEPVGWFAIWIVSAVLVFVDADKWEKKGAKIGALGWAILAFLLPIAGVPLYLFSARPRARDEVAKAERERILSRPKGTPDPAKTPALAPDARFACPVCGESIPVVAKMCRFCNAVITDKDRPQPLKPSASVTSKPRAR
jgi:hypothetical protein